MSESDKFREGRNPIFPPGVYAPDPEAHVMPDGRVYLYGSWDAKEGEYCSREYRVFSSENLVDWVAHGKSFDSDAVDWIDDREDALFSFGNIEVTPFLQKVLDDQKLEGGAQVVNVPKRYLYAPDVLHKNGKYYLYFCASDSSEGVATSDSPAGPFVNPVKLDCIAIDPAVFMDDDGQIYYYWGQFSSNGAKLKQSLTEIDQTTVVSGLLTEKDHFFHEGSSVRKRGDLYYYVYASIERGKPTSLGYAVSKSPLGPFERKGVIVDNSECDPQSWNNHGSIEEIHGQWYVFYHRSSRNSRYMRRVCMEPITFNQDGTINEALMTSQGAGKPFAIGERIDAWRTCGLAGAAYLAPREDGREVLRGVKGGDTATFRYVDFGSKAKGVVLESSGSGEVEIFLDQLSPVPQGKIKIEDGCIVLSSWQPVAGVHSVILKMKAVKDFELVSLTFS